MRERLMSNVVVEVENVSKRYQLGVFGGKTLREDVQRWWAKLRGQPDPLSKVHQQEQATSENAYVWALRDINFNVEKGEVLGLIGHNGAGKSTLLKVLTRITAPTEGRIRMKGRVASMLEVGTGFHPELTGRENVYLNGAILGMTRAEVDSKFDEIVAFSGVEQYIDTPVKRYSSGMKVRLAFAVAAHLEPEILLVDEVLAVGDAAFQKRCLGKMGDVAEAGRTVIFVSHQMGAIKSLCERTVLLDGGRLVRDGKTSDVIAAYLESSLDTTQSQSGERHWGRADKPPGNDDLSLRRIRLLDQEGRVQQRFDVGHPITVELEYKVSRDLRGLRFILSVKTADGTLAFSSTDQNEQQDTVSPGLYLSKCIIPARLLNRGRYFISIHAGIPKVKVLISNQALVDLYVDGVTSHGSHFPENWKGVVCPELEWIVRPISSSATS